MRRRGIANIYNNCWGYEVEISTKPQLNGMLWDPFMPSPGLESGPCEDSPVSA